MTDALSLFQQKKLVLIMSLPKNDPALCKAAFDAGADLVKVHINVDHRASGTHFGRLSDERNALEKMLSMEKGPMGLVLGGSLEQASLDWQEACTLPFALHSIYAHHMPAKALQNGTPLMAACDGSYSLGEIAGMQKMHADILEASVIPGNEYGQALSMRDLLKYQSIVMATELPVVVPTQRAIRPEEVPMLASTGIRGLMIGAIVTGQEIDSLSQSVSAFRKAIDEV